jgi:ABC-type Fe3+ transport system substrate-binding protein
MRHYFYILLFVIVLLAPFAMRRAVRGDRDAGDPAGAGARRLVVITPHNQDIRREFARAFNAWHVARFGEPVEVDYRTPGGTNDIKRQLDDTYRSWRQPDGTLRPDFPADVHVVWGGGPFYFDKELKPLDILQPLRLDPRLLAAAYPEPTIAGVPLYEGPPANWAAGGAARPRWVGVCLSAFGIVYNPDVYRTLGLPEPAHWHDLTHPRLAGQLALADPTHSGSASVAYMVIVERRMADAEEAYFEQNPAARQLPVTERAKQPGYDDAIAAGWQRGMGELLLIAANSRYFTDSASQVPNDVGNGDSAAGIAIDFYGRVYQEMVGPDRCRVVMPAGATAITPDPVAILAGVRGPELELATRFVEFLLTAEGQLLWILKPGHPGGPAERGLRRPPVRRDLYADRTGWTDDVNPFAEAGGFNQREDFEALFSDTRPVWTAAWIDSREGLRDAYATILRVPGPQHRDALLAELARLPVTMADVAKARSERKDREKSGGAEEWKARHRIELVNRFRDHYATVAAKAAPAR